MIERFDRVYVSCASEYGRVSEIIPTRIMAIKQYRVEFAEGRSGIYGEAFVQPAPHPKDKAPLRLATINGEVIG